MAANREVDTPRVALDHAENALSSDSLNPLVELEQKLIAYLRDEVDAPASVLDQAIVAAQQSHTDLVRFLLRSGVVAEQDVAAALCVELDVTMCDELEHFGDASLMTTLSPAFVRENLVLCERRSPTQCIMVTPYVHDPYIKQAVGLALGCEIETRAGLRSELEARLRQLEIGDWGSNLDGAGHIDREAAAGELDLAELASEEPVIRYVNRLFADAVDQRASDIHLEPFEHECRVRFRIDGMLEATEAPPNEDWQAVISRIKIIAGLDIAERRLPQDGRTMVRVQGKPIDMRVAVVPVMYGESIVIRLLDKSDIALELGRLGFSDETEAQLREAASAKDGLFLVTGPTGSGKSTTLYCLLNEVANSVSKVITVEDPVEYQLEGVNQIQVKPNIGLDFPSSLRAILRQDPDVIMIGETRDAETAQIAIQSALTGHLVLSTLHTIDAPSSVTRLKDLNVEPFLISSTLRGALAQRLARRLCAHCARALEGEAGIAELLQIEEAKVPKTLREPVGCDQCRGSGYHGRVAIAELMIVERKLQTLIAGGADANELRRVALENGMISLKADTLRLIEQGLTSVTEAARVLYATE